MNLQQLIQSGLFDVIVNSIRDVNEARQILIAIGFQPGRFPKFPRNDDEDWGRFWLEVCESIVNGILDAGIDLTPLLREAARRRPGVAALKRFAANPPPTAPAQQAQAAGEAAAVEERVWTVLDLDLIGYSDKARQIQEHIGPAGTLKLNDQIRDFIDDGLRRVQLDPAAVVKQGTGDGALILFESAQQCHLFAAAVHEICKAHNRTVTKPEAERWFRMGAATGLVAIRNRDGQTSLAGIAIANAVRLETAGDLGHMLIDAATYDRLPTPLKGDYLQAEEVPGKRDEWFTVRRRIFVSDAPPRTDHVVLSLEMTRLEFSDAAASAFLRELSRTLKCRPDAIRIAGLRSGSLQVVLQFSDERDLGAFRDLYLTGDDGLQEFFATWQVKTVQFHSLSFVRREPAAADQPAGADPAEPAPPAVTTPTPAGRFQAQDIEAAKKWNPQILLMVANRVELEELLKQLQLPLSSSTGIWKVRSGNRTYYCGHLGLMRVVATMCEQGNAGPGASQAAAAESIDAFKPGALILVGIAFGVNSQKQRFGDVLVASQLICYEWQRVGKGGMSIYRGPQPNSTGFLLDRFKNALDWTFPRPDGSACAVKDGPLLSGEKLIDDLVYRDQLLSEFPKAIGGEMEGAGVYAAAESKNVPWIVVKAISDFADGMKEAGANDVQVQPQAAAAAVSLVQYALSEPGFLNDAA